MIKKERSFPVKLYTLQALLRRLPKHHPKYQSLQDECLRRKAGLKGEQSIDYELSQLHTKEDYIFHDLRLPNREQFFQLDTLLVTKSFIVIIEVKNIAGTVYFDKKFNQLIRSYNGVEEAFSDPLLQIKRQRLHLMELIRLHKFNIPVESLIVFSNPHTLIKASPEYAPHELSNIIHRAELPFRMNLIKDKYQKEIITPKDMKKLSSVLLKYHTHEAISAESFGVRKEDVIRGVHCPPCNYIPMERKRKKWYCTACNDHSKTAHIDSLSDYSLLISNTISNKELRDFLQIPSRCTSLYLLQSMSLESTGATKDKRYLLNLERSSCDCITHRNYAPNKLFW
ncbi:nuclease-related domain-containing protein [Bacillus pinisoli]|uniref:nuclease-related domain-containing protein n=1 Tax=Bacillus pinisoli TaxID=2901866 RepID=UPI001FF318EA|nr:nuclease-related domain-containing protein [Bacillus pinisoli]